MKDQASASTGLLTTGYVVLVPVTAIAANLDGLLAGSMFGGRSPEVSADVPVGYVLTCAATLLWSLVVVLSGAASRTWWAISPMGIALAAYALRVVIVGFHHDDVLDLLILPLMITTSSWSAYTRGRTSRLDDQRL